MFAQIIKKLRTAECRRIYEVKCCTISYIVFDKKRGVAGCLTFFVAPFYLILTPEMECLAQTVAQIRYAWTIYDAEC